MADEVVRANAFPDPKERTPTILVVDDEVLIRMALSDFLQKCGFKVLEASNAAEAIEIVQSHLSVLDLVFSDNQDAGRDGRLRLVEVDTTKYPATGHPYVR
jgi:CheY-like chemotaxis protein